MCTCICAYTCIHTVREIYMGGIEIISFMTSYYAPIDFVVMLCNVKLNNYNRFNPMCMGYIDLKIEVWFYVCKQIVCIEVFFSMNGSH